MVCDVPSIIPFNGDITFVEYDNKIYEKFQIEYEDLKLKFSYKGKELKFRYSPVENGKIQLYWHITTTDFNLGNRSPDLERLSKISWGKYVLLNCFLYGNECSYAWKRLRTEKIHIWCYTLQYMVVLEERNDYLLFITAYPVNRAHTHDKLLREYNNIPDKNLIYF